MTTLLMLQLAAVTWTVQVSATTPTRPPTSQIQPYLITRVTTKPVDAFQMFVTALCDQPSPFSKPLGGVYTIPPIDAIAPEQLVFDDPLNLKRLCILDLRLLMLYLPRGDWIIALLRTDATGIATKQVAPMFHKP